MRAIRLTCRPPSQDQKCSSNEDSGSNIQLHTYRNVQQCKTNEPSGLFSYVGMFMSTTGRSISLNHHHLKENTTSDDDFDGVWQSSSDRMPFYWLVAFRLITTASIALTVCEYVWLYTRIPPSMRSSLSLMFSHLTVWYNILAAFAMVAVWFQLLIDRACATMTRSVVARVVRCIASVSLTMQHPLSWVVFFGYWVTAILETEHIEIVNAWMYLPGVVCTDDARTVIQSVAAGNSTNVYSYQMNTCLMASHVNILTHTLVPVLMSRQLSICRAKTTMWTYLALTGCLIAYFICFVVYSEQNGACPYSEICYLGGNHASFLLRITGGILFVVVRLACNKKDILTGL